MSSLPKKEQHLFHSLGAMRDFAREFAFELKGGEVIELVGELGSGKTTFVRAVAEALNVASKVKSPSFTVMQEYPIDFGEMKRLVHLDLYRFEKEADLDSLALEEEVNEETVMFIEWPNAVSSLPVATSARLTFSIIDADSREVVYERFS